MTWVSELIYQKEQVIIWDYAVAHDNGEWGGGRSHAVVCK